MDARITARPARQRRRGGDGPTPYEQLLTGAMRGDRSLFARQDAVEETWRIVQPLLNSPPQVIPYAQGTWGPPEAEKLVEGIAAWHEPWLPDSTT